MKRCTLYVVLSLSILTITSIGCLIAGLASHAPANLATHIDTDTKHVVIDQTQQHIVPASKLITLKQTTSRNACDATDLKSLLACPDGSIKQALFSPDDNLETVLINLINNEQEMLKIAVFSFTNGAIAQAVMDAVDRGVQCQLIIDSSCTKDRFNKIAMLEEKGIVPLVYHAPSVTILNDIMHNKFVIFRKNIADKSLLWTGSFNFTKSAQLKNQENVVVLDEPYLIEKYEHQFDVIKERITHPKLHDKKMDSPRSSRAVVAKNNKSKKRRESVAIT